MRLATNPRVWTEPSQMRQVVEFVEAIRASPAYVSMEPGLRHWSLLTQLLDGSGCRADDVPDVSLAAVAIEHGAQLVSYDTGFARFPAARWIRPGQAVG